MEELLTMSQGSFIHSSLIISLVVLCLTAVFIQLSQQKNLASFVFDQFICKVIRPSSKIVSTQISPASLQGLAPKRSHSVPPSPLLNPESSSNSKSTMLKHSCNSRNESRSDESIQDKHTESLKQEQTLTPDEQVASPSKATIPEKKQHGTEPSSAKKKIPKQQRQQTTKPVAIEIATNVVPNSLPVPSSPSSQKPPKKKSPVALAAPKLSKSPMVSPVPHPISVKKQGVVLHPTPSPITSESDSEPQIASRDDQSKSHPHSLSNKIVSEERPQTPPPVVTESVFPQTPDIPSTPTSGTKTKKSNKRTSNALSTPASTPERDTKDCISIPSDTRIDTLTPNLIDSMIVSENLSADSQPVVAQRYQTPPPSPTKSKPHGQSSPPKMEDKSPRTNGPMRFLFFSGPIESAPDGVTVSSSSCTPADSIDVAAVSESHVETQASVVKITSSTLIPTEKTVATTKKSRKKKKGTTVAELIPTRETKSSSGSAPSLQKVEEANASKIASDPVQTSSSPVLQSSTVPFKAQSPRMLVRNLSQASDLSESNGAKSQNLYSPFLSGLELDLGSIFLVESNATQRKSQVSGEFIPSFSIPAAQSPSTFEPHLHHHSFSLFSY